MSVAKTQTRDTFGEPGGGRRDAFILLQLAVLVGLLSGARNRANLSIGTTTTKARTNAACDFAVDGNLFQKASTDDLFTLTGAAFGSTSTSQFNKYLLLLDAAGTASVVACTPSVVSADAVVIPDLHATLDGKSLIGVLTIATVNVVFTPATTALNAAGVTATYQNGIDKNMLKLLTDESARVIRD